MVVEYLYGSICCEIDTKRGSVLRLVVKNKWQQQCFVAARV